MKITEPKPSILFIPEIKQHIKDKNLQPLKTLLKEMHPVDIVECLISLTKDEKLILFNMLSRNKLIEVFEEMPYEEQINLINHLEEETLTNLLNEIEMPSVKSLFTKAPDRVKRKLLSLVKREKVDTVKQVITYPPKTVGTIMHTDFIAIYIEQTAKQALEYIQLQARLHKAENLYAFYIIDKENHLLGGVSLKKLISAPPDMKIKELMSNTAYIELSPYDPIGNAVNLFDKYDLVIAPVVDQEHKLIGVIMIDDIMDVSVSTSLTQLHGFGKITTSKEIKYSNLTSPFMLVKNRLPWLVMLAVLGYVGSEIIKIYENAITTVAALAFFIPMLCDTGGNAGCQTTTTLVRSFATGDINPRTVFKAISYEIVSALIMGLIVGCVGVVRALVMVKGDIFLSLVVGISVFAVIILAAITGLTLPFIARLLKIDPAAVTAPMITTIVDIAGLFIYFRIATLFLPVLKQI